MLELVAPFPHYVRLLKKPLHRAGQTVLASLVQQGGPNRDGRAINEPGTMKQIHDLPLFLRTQGPRKTRSKDSRFGRLPRSAKRTARHLEHLAGSSLADLIGQFFNPFH